MSQGNPLENLNNAGYSQGVNQDYKDELWESDPTNYQSSLTGFKGYNPATAAAATAAPAAQTRAQQEGLISQLQQGAAGIGPNAGAAQLTAATGANIKNQAALAAAAGASGAGGAGAARYNAADQAGQINQEAGNQAAQIGAQGQQAAIQGLAGVTGQVAGQDLSQQQIANENAQFNATANNQAGQFNAKSLQDQAALQEQAYEFQQKLLAESQGAQNSYVAGLEGQHESTTSSDVNAGIGGATGGLSGLFSLAAKGKVIAGPRKLIAGEAGREAEVPIPARDVPRGTPKLAAGGIIAPPQKDYTQHLAGLPGFVASVVHGIRSRGAAPAAQPGLSPANNWSSPVTSDPLLGGGGEQGDFAPAPTIGAPAATGRLLTRPTLLEAGEAGPEAIIPVKKDGSADMKRAKDPAVRQLLTQHPEFKHPMDHLAELKAEVAKLEKVLKSTRRKAST